MLGEKGGSSEMQGVMYILCAPHAGKGLPRCLS